jgi:hypothetical protein
VRPQTERLNPRLLDGDPAELILTPLPLADELPDPLLVNDHVARSRIVQALARSDGLVAQDGEIEDRNPSTMISLLPLRPRPSQGGPSRRGSLDLT